MDVTILLEEARSGNEEALNQLVPLVYDELRRIASGRLRSAGPGQTMLTTDLVHESFLKLIGSWNLSWQNRLHFFSIAATSMRQIIVDHARARKRLKGELDTIVLTALEKDPSRRYISVEQFAEDIRRHLSDVPIQARPASIRRRIVKFARRNRLLVGVAAARIRYERTDRLLCATLLVFSMMLFSSCGYTILETRSKAGQDPVEEALPDLVIEDISNYTKGEGPYADSSEPYRWITVFGARVTNRGTADFAGRVALAWTDDPDEIRYGMYRAVGGEGYLRLMPDSSGIIRGSLGVVYRPGTPLLFTILTDRFEPGQVGELYEFGSTPYQELSTKNNTLLYTVE